MGILSCQVLRVVAGCALSLAPLVAAAACNGQPWLTLEVVAGELQGDGLAEFVEIDRDGCVLSQYAEFDIRAGQYRRQLSLSEQSALAAALDESALMNYNAEAHREQRAAAERIALANGSGRLHHVAEAHWVRLQLHDAGGTVHLIQWPSPELYAELDPADGELRKLAHFIRRVRAEGADARRSELTGASP